MKKYVKILICIILITIIFAFQNVSLCEESYNDLYAKVMEETPEFSATVDYWKETLDAIVTQEFDGTPLDVANKRKELLEEQYNDWFKNGFAYDKDSIQYKLIDLLFSNYRSVIDESIKNAEENPVQETEDPLQNAKNKFDNLYNQWKTVKKQYENKEISFEKYKAQLERISADLSSAWHEIVRAGETDENLVPYTTKCDEVSNALMDAQTQARNKEDAAKNGDKYIIYNNPEITDTDDRKTGSNLDGVIDGAEDFMDKDTGSSPMQTDDLSDFSKTLSGILMTIAIIVSVIMAGILGIKFMLGGVDEKSEVKQMIIPYIVGCVVVFGSFAIWNLVVSILNNI